MITALSTLARAGVVALGVLTGLTAGAVSAPLGPIDRLQTPAKGLPVQPVVDGEFRGGTHPIWPRFQRGGNEWRGGGVSRGGGQWQGNRKWRGNRAWQGNNGKWQGNRKWHGRRNWNKYRRYRNYDNDFGVGIALGLGVPLLGGYYGGPGYHDPYYAPRRYYRAPVAGNTHVRWCYARYRSYRAWDNSFQPYNGPRRQCYSPYG
jgi:BA14K-like protein